MFLERCLLSVQKQSFNDYEVIIVNDGSTDRSQEIIEKFAKKDPLHFKYIVQDNTGPGGARNAGIRNASGDYFLFLDSDDYIHQDTLLLGKYYLDRYGLDILKFGARIVYSDNAEEINHLPEVIPELIRYQPWDKEQFIMNANGPQSFFYSARLFLDNDLCWPEIIWYEDNAIIPVFALFADQIGRINAPLYQYYQNSSGITHSHNTQRIPEILNSADITLSYFEKYRVLQKYKDELEYRIVVQVLFSHCFRLFTAGKEIERAR